MHQNHGRPAIKRKHSSPEDVDMAAPCPTPGGSSPANGDPGFPHLYHWVSKMKKIPAINNKHCACCHVLLFTRTAGTLRDAATLQRHCRPSREQVSALSQRSFPRKTPSGTRRSGPRASALIRRMRPSVFLPIVAADFKEVSSSCCWRRPAPVIGSASSFQIF